MGGDGNTPLGGILGVDPATTPPVWRLEPKLPSKGKVAKNAARSVGKTLASVMQGKPLAAEDVEKRRAICDECEYQKGNRCLKCGCFLKFKTWLKADNCPVGKW
jgi:hypothetical protein